VSRLATFPSGGTIGLHLWERGPNHVVVVSRDGKAVQKMAHLATPLETLQWYAKKGAEKIGVKWD